MQKISDVFIQNINNLPIWVKQVITKEVMDDLNKKLEDFEELIETNNLLQYVKPKLTFKGKQELQSKDMRLSDGYYVFMQELVEGNNIFEITLKSNWSFTDSAKIFIRLIELELVQSYNGENDTFMAVAMFIAGKIKTGEFLKRIGKIDAFQLEKAIRYQKELNEEGRHIKMASILIKSGYITDKGLDSLLLLKDEAKKRLPVNVGITSLKYDSAEEENSQILSMQREIARLENENLIMKKRLKKILKIND